MHNNVQAVKKVEQWNTYKSSNGSHLTPPFTNLQQWDYLVYIPQEHRNEKTFRWPDINDTISVYFIWLTMNVC